MKTIAKIDSGRNWAVAKIDHETGKYYRKLYEKWSGVRLKRPMQDEHVTFITPWDGIKIPKITGIVDVEIILNPATNGNAIWYPVISEDLTGIRNFLNLGEIGIPLHFCIGYLMDGKLKNNDFCS